MKGVIKRVTPNAKIVDLTHTIKQGNIKEAAFLISKSWQYFPEGSIHVVVVDPGVGTERKIIILEKGKSVFITPDNGVLSYLLEEKDRLFLVDEESYWLKPVSRTFHGRDIFAPVAAFVAKGLPLISLASPTNELKKLPQPFLKLKESEIRGEIIAEDSFGNLITSIEEKHFRGKKVKKVKLGDIDIHGPVNSFEEGKGKGLSCIIDSFGHLEIFIYLGSASRAVPEWKEKRVIVELL